MTRYSSILETIGKTPVVRVNRLAPPGINLYVKNDTVNPTNSFKDRGAFVKLASLSDAERARGVITMSAGNHAQAVAYHAERLGIPATIVMPVTTPFVKVAATRSYGAEVVLYGETVAEAQSRCEQIQAQRGLLLVHPYDEHRDQRVCHATASARLRRCGTRRAGRSRRASPTRRASASTGPATAATPR